MEDECTCVYCVSVKEARLSLGDEKKEEGGGEGKP
jgi:hypothetical protein